MPETLEDIELKSEEVQEILTEVPRWIIRWGNLLLLGLIALLLAICWLVKYPDFISSKALITTQIPPQKEYARSSGKFDALLVENNASVAPEQALAVIENTADYQSVFLLKSIIDTVSLKNQFVHVPIDQLSHLFLGDIEPQYALFENSYLQYKLNKEYQPFYNEALANLSSVEELKIQLQNLKSQQEIGSKELLLAKKELDRSKWLFNEEVISAQEHEKKLLEYAQNERNQATVKASISQLRQSISVASKTLKASEIDKIKEETILLKAVIQSFNQLKKAIRDWEYKYVFRSNIFGTVSYLNVWTENQSVNQGDLVMTIVPNKNSTFIAKLRTQKQNSGKIKPGQSVNIKLENYPAQEFGTLNGTVKNISLITDKDGFYVVDVELPKTLITSFNKPIEFKHEMTGSAEIVTEELRLIERFFYQFKGIFN